MVEFNIQATRLVSALTRWEKWLVWLFLAVISVAAFIHYYQNGLGLAYNDARSHLDIGRRVVEGLKPGLAQLGSVWLPLPHLLMVPTIWNDFMWHSGLAGALVSMISFVMTGLLIYQYARILGIGWLGRLVALLLFVTNINVLYLQSTAMTELILLATMMAGTYYLLLWSEQDDILLLVKAAFWVMLSTLVRYDGWFLLIFSAGFVAVQTWRRKGYRTAEGISILFATLAGLGIALWLLWNLLIFKDPLYFAFGPFSAHAQQDQLEVAGVLATKGNIWLSIKFYFYALTYNVGALTVVLGSIGAVAFWLRQRVSVNTRLASTLLFVPLVFNVVALYLGHSVLFIQGLSGTTWFNIRYGIMMAPALVIFVGYVVDRLKGSRLMLLGLLVFVGFFSITSYDAVTIDDARVGSSQKNVSEVSSWLKQNAADKEGFILISAASHDAIIFSSGLPMKRFIHEGTGAYWESATTTPDRWARWMILRTNDNNDLTFKLVNEGTGLSRYNLVAKYDFADVYELQPEYLRDLTVKPTLGKQK